MSNFVVNLITRGCSGSKPEAVLPCDMHLEMYEDNFVCHNDWGAQQQAFGMQRPGMLNVLRVGNSNTQ